jgi:hypothetical protein
VTASTLIGAAADGYDRRRGGGGKLGAAGISPSSLWVALKEGGWLGWWEGGWVEFAP